MNPTSSPESTQSSVTLLLRGAWSGHVTDPQREFKGQLEAPFADFPAGTAVQVHFEAPRARVQGAQEHGVYELHIGRQHWKLSAMVHKQAAQGGRAAQDDTQEMVWTATLPSGVSSS